MHDVRDGFMEWFRIDDCRRMDPDLRYELEVLGSGLNYFKSSKPV